MGYCNCMRRCTATHCWKVGQRLATAVLVVWQGSGYLDKVANMALVCKNGGIEMEVLSN